LLVAAATRGRERAGLRGITVAEQLLDAALRVIEPPRAGSREADALLEDGERLLERQLAALQALHDQLEASEDLLEAGLAIRAFAGLRTLHAGTMPQRGRRGQFKTWSALHVALEAEEDLAGALGLGGAGRHGHRQP